MISQGHLSVHVRDERPLDYAAIAAVHEAAFGGDEEARLVGLLRDQARPYIGLLAEVEGLIVAHIAFSPVSLEHHPECRLMGLAPMAVLPEYQRRGIGSTLVQAGLARCRQLGTDAVLVLGHPGYYPRFGFVPAAHYKIDSNYDVPADVFRLIELKPGALEGKTGRVHYHPAFDGL